MSDPVQLITEVTTDHGQLTTDRQKTIHMKTNKVLFLALIVSVAFAVSAQAGDRHRNNGNAQTVRSAPAHYSGGAIHSASPRFAQRSGSSSMGRNFQSSPRMTSRSMPQFSQRHFNSGGNAPIVHRQFTPRTFDRSNGSTRFQSNGNSAAVPRNRVNRFSSLNNRGLNGTGGESSFTRSGNNRPIQTNRFSQMQGGRRGGTAQLQGQGGNRTARLGTGGGNRTVGNISPGHNHVFAQQSVGWHRDWDRHSDHWWNGHRCRWVNNSWFIFDIGFIPWFGWPYYDYYAYDYYPSVYPYGYGYGYDSGASYGSNYYGQNGYDSSYDDQGGYDSSYDDQNGNGSYDQSTAATVADVQDQLARAGYYHGQIDGVLGPETRHALVRYQSDKGLEPSGNLTSETLRSLGVQRVARY